MKSLHILTRIFLILILILVVSCKKESDKKNSPSPDNNNSEEQALTTKKTTSDSLKALLPLMEGSIRGYFDNEYKIFTDHIEKVQPVDSFSNCYFYENCQGTYADICSGPMKQINLIRCDSTYVVALYIMGVSPDSLPVENPVPSVFCRYAELHFYKFENWNWVPNDPDCYNFLNVNFYGQKVLITENKDDVLTGTFGGDLVSPVGKKIHVSEGEFKIRIVRKSFPCWKKN